MMINNVIPDKFLDSVLSSMVTDPQLLK